MLYATPDEFREQFRPLTEVEDARLERLLRRASRMIDAHVRIDPLDAEQLVDAKDVVLDMVSRAFPETPGTTGLKSWTRTAGAVSESATAADSAIGIGGLELLPWHLELLGAALTSGPRFHFPRSRLPRWL